MPVRIHCGNRKSAPSAVTLLSAALEAQALLPLLENGETVEMIRSLIDVTPAEKKAMYRTETRFTIARAVQHRRAILAAFDKLMARGRHGEI